MDRRLTTFYGLIALGVVTLGVGPAIGELCNWCGCRGGPGWRIHATGKCASHKQFDKACGNPPDPAKCTDEGSTKVLGVKPAIPVESAPKNPMPPNSRSAQ